MSVAFLRLMAGTSLGPGALRHDACRCKPDSFSLGFEHRASAVTAPCMILEDPRFMGELAHCTST